MTIPNVPLPQGIGADGSPRCQEAMGDSIAQTRSERVPILPYDLPLSRVNILGSDEGSMTLLELTVLCTTFSKKVESLEADLKQTKKGKTIEEINQYAGVTLVTHIDQDAGVTLVTPTHSQEDQHEDQLGVFSAAKVLTDASKTNVHTYTRRRRAVSTDSGRISTASRLFSTAEESVSTVGASIPVSTAGMVQEVNISIPSPVVVKDKGKEWENNRVRVEVDEELSKRLQAEERNKYSKVDQAKMLVDLINQRKKYFATHKAKAKRNKPITQVQ
ncbi:hypothetical protein Tco_0686325 [Tanacetum coccineum]